MLAVSRGLPSLIIIGALTVGPAQAQNLDQDKSGAKLFATNCTDCHRSPRGLAKQVELDAVILFAAALHRQPRLGACAHRLSAVG